MVLRMFEMISVEEEKVLDHNDVSVFNKRSFFLGLAYIMMKEGRDDGDKTKTVIWNTNRSRRFADQFTEDGYWRVDYLLLKVNYNTVRTEIPISIRQEEKMKEVKKKINSRVKDELSEEDQLLKTVTNTFNSKEAVLGQNSCLRYIVTKMMLFLKRREHRNFVARKDFIRGELVLPNREGVFASVTGHFAEFYEIYPGVNLRKFFWDRNSYRNFLKRTFLNAGRMLKDDSNKSNMKLEEVVKFNENEWFKDGNKALEGIYRYSEDVNRSDEMLRLQAMIRERYPPNQIHAYACSTKLFPIEYAKFLYAHFINYKLRLVREIRDEMNEGYNEEDAQADYGELPDQQRKRQRNNQVSNERRAGHFNFLDE